MMEYFINQTSFNTTSTLKFIYLYTKSMPSLVRSGDFTAITIAIVVFLVSLIIINKITTAMMKVIESFLVLTIISYASYLFVSVFISRYHTYGATPSNIALLLIGSLSIILGLFGGIATLLKSTSTYDKIDEEIEKIKSQPSPVSMFNQFTEGNNIGKRIVYLIISEFGVFSSKTISAPNPTVGAVIFFIFIFGALAYIMSLKERTKEVEYFLITLIAGMAIAIILAVTWSSMPLKEVLSLRFFDSDALVAVVTGTAISMYMGSK